MSTTAVPSSATATPAKAKRVDLKLEVVGIPVADVERAKAFYEKKLGWRLDADFKQDGEHVVQVTPPGSPCSVHFGTNITSAAPGSAQQLWLIVSDIQEARAELVARGVDVSEVFHFAGWNRLDPKGRLSGPAPGRATYASFASFNDPDGNGWLLQEITTRLPGRVDPGAISFATAADLVAAFTRAETAHGAYETRIGKGRHAEWAEWYAAYMIAEQAGTELPS
jgi:catechol 2,3-dioxygenase-like lactoylglutathione lyase family enzyme